MGETSNDGADLAERLPGLPDSRFWPTSG